MKALFRLIIIPFILLTACSKQKEKPLTVEEFQEVTDSLEEHQFKFATINTKVTTTSNYPLESYTGVVVTSYSLDYSFDDVQNKWILTSDARDLLDAYKPQTLRRANIAEMMDRRYEYTFYVKPMRVHMYRSIDNSEYCDRGYITIDWEYDEYGYLMYNHYYMYKEFDDPELDYQISDTVREYTYRQ